MIFTCSHKFLHDLIAVIDRPANSEEGASTSKTVKTTGVSSKKNQETQNLVFLREDWSPLDADFLSSGVFFDFFAKNPGDKYILWCDSDSETEKSINYLYENIESLNLKKGNVLFAAPEKLSEVYQMWTKIGAACQKGFVARDRVNRLESQIADLCKNFYSRTKNKKVVIISSLDPLEVAGKWLNDAIKLSAAQPFVPKRKPRVSVEKTSDYKTEWEDIIEFNPDVILVAPRGKPQDFANKLLLQLEKLESWGKIFAVKRGEVVFTGGDDKLYYPGFALLDSVRVLFSAIAGLESGYITDKDSYRRLRWLEMNRHTIK
jgi:hypothetical protein